MEAIIRQVEENDRLGAQSQPQQMEQLQQEQQRTISKIKKDHAARIKELEEKHQTKLLIKDKEK